jgi:hypothetical protein
VIEWDLSKPVAQQHHQLIVCTASHYMMTQMNWSVIEKETILVVVANSEPRYLPDWEFVYNIYCDHANLIRMFSPDKELGQHTQGKLQRGTLKFMECSYIIEHIAGGDIMWADIVSSWGQQTQTPNDTIKRVSTRNVIEQSALRPMHDDEFVWPSLGKFCDAQ